jgi:AcrR family transcriptional regulator
MDSSEVKQRGRPRDEHLPERRREEILDVATRIFAERSYPGTDVQAVADAIGVGKGTIYRYFPTKQELFFAAVDRGLLRLRARLGESRAAAGADTVDQMKAAVLAYLTFFEENPAVVELLIQERAEFRDRAQPTYFVRCEEDLGPWHDDLRRLIAAGRMRDIPPEQITQVAGDLLFGTMYANYLTGRKRDPRTQAATILNIVLHGLLIEREGA